MKASKNRPDGDIAYRALRSDEWGLYRRGLTAPDEESDSVDAFTHVSLGSRCRKVREHSPYLSASRSLDVAAAWAATSQAQGASQGRVAKFYFKKKANDYDLTNTNDIEKFMNGRSNPRVLNSVRRSQELLKHKKVHPKNIIESYMAIFLKKREYMAYVRAGFSPDFQVVTAAARAKETPRPIKVMSESIYYLNKAKRYWKTMPDEIASEVNEKIESPFEMDYIATVGEYNKYIAAVEKIRRTVLQCTPRGQ
ncbi:hypothetical protein [Serratia entomophila]|uniref:hypothetical protein n=1 Tax=Serratia entomophila TaxID=42906 RepID=UPI00217C82A4|nr:hypothetical protein [Serratia entomophila]CAI1561991.1 Uncharacterised protein [Serratia entomophila]